MANIKDVDIQGDIPFDLNENEYMIKLLGQLNMPSCGLRISWKEESEKISNKYGGVTSMIRFVISGQEAVAWTFLEYLIKTLKNSGARIDVAKVADIEDAPGQYFSLI